MHEHISHAADSRVETFTFRVEPFHVDFSGHLFLGILGNHLLNAADHHSDRRGWGITYLLAHNCTWVLSRLCIEMSEMPRQYELVVVETWVEDVIRLFTSRNFLIRSAADGHVYGYARSIWAMIDTHTRQPVDLLSFKDGDILQYVIPAEEKACPIARHGRVRVAAAEPVRRVHTYYDDVDINGHINSIKYVEHVLDLFPRERFATQRIRRFEIAYKSEALWGDDLCFHMQETASPADGIATESDIEIRRHEAGDLAAKAETTCQVKLIWVQA